ncbi:histone deacetylase family protein [Maritimibacter fusiformis]|uniref:Histone deacetylase family protein n=1 Tax=Maritimibacter fusiformis TaxID=2603819 RepID=A0A5D0RAS8_9RHOB|nr:histone deacetylase family protein [Maritimibacter fusiformis]TYB77808.1 histone deacetylase family protein [Maritimibacter fusiformis]
MTTALFTHPDCLDHINPPGHPEQVARLKAIDAALAAPGFATLDRREAPLGDEADIRRAHPKVHLDRIRASAPAEGLTQIDPDTSMSPGSLTAAYRAVGGAVAAVDAVLTGEAGNAFVACRPPGHHAERARPMGFCLFSNAAIAALHALDVQGLDRVAVLDFDVHHGNGTQDVLWNESRARFASSHQMPLYPGTGGAHEKGAYEQILNVPLSEGSGGERMRAEWEGSILPWISEFRPELIVVSAGFDAHARDPLAGLHWQTEDFGWLTHRICDLADDVCDGRVVSTLEGGYDLEALAESVALHVEILMERGK